MLIACLAPRILSQRDRCVFAASDLGQHLTNIDSSGGVRLGERDPDRWALRSMPTSMDLLGRVAVFGVSRRRALLGALALTGMLVPVGISGAASGNQVQAQSFERSGLDGTCDDPPGDLPLCQARPRTSE